MKEKKSSKWMVKAIGLACATAVLTTGTMAFAATGSKNVQVVYNNIKLLVDGAAHTPRDSDGVEVEPFILNGTTYLPVRAVAEAFGKEVSWDSGTATVVIGASGADYLDQMAMYGYETTNKFNAFKAWEKGRKGTDGIAYDRGLAFNLDYYNGGAVKRNDGVWESWQTAEYLLSGNYQHFMAKLVCAERATNNQNVIIKMYGDDQLLYTSPPLTGGSRPAEVDFSVKNVKVLKISLSVPNLVTDYGNPQSIIGLTNARLTK